MIAFQLGSIKEINRNHLSEENIWVKRPGAEIFVKHFQSIIGKKSKTKCYPKDHRLEIGRFE